MKIISAILLAYFVWISSWFGVLLVVGWIVVTHLIFR